MLTKITLDNFKSFKNAETIDLTKTNYTILPQNVADNGLSPQDKIAGGAKLSLLRPIRGAGGYDDTRGVLLYGQHGGFGGGLCGSFRGGVLRALADNGSACGKRGGIRGNADILKTATRFCERVVFAYRVHGAQSIKLFCKVLASP